MQIHIEFGLPVETELEHRTGFPEVRVDRSAPDQQVAAQETAGQEERVDGERAVQHQSGEKLVPDGVLELQVIFGD